jgi:hypothetical protein
VYSSENTVCCLLECDTRLSGRNARVLDDSVAAITSIMFLFMEIVGSSETSAQ